MMSVWKWAESPLVDGDRLLGTRGITAAATLVALDKKSTGKRGLARPRSRPSATRRKRRSRLFVRRHLERRRRQAVHPAHRPRPGPRFAGPGRQVPLGLQQGRQRHREHPDADREGRPRLRLDRLPDRQRAAPAEAGRRRQGEGGLLPRQQVAPEPPWRPGAPRRPHLRRSRPPRGASRSASRSRRARSPGAATSATRAPAPPPRHADGHLYFRYEDGRWSSSRPRRRAIRRRAASRSNVKPPPSWSHPVVAGGKPLSAGAGHALRPRPAKSVRLVGLVAPAGHAPCGTARYNTAPHGQHRSVSAPDPQGRTRPPLARRSRPSPRPRDHPLPQGNPVQIHVSGGEFNVAANLADCFRLNTGIATAMVDYPIGDLIAERVRAMGVRPFYKLQARRRQRPEHGHRL